jgi:hypothetical protein
MRSCLLLLLALAACDVPETPPDMDARVHELDELHDEDSG